jgi:putative ABC transport system permease protein
MTPLHSAVRFAIRLMQHERTRLAASVGGVTFALLLMLLQLGFRNALLDSGMELLRQMDADVLVVHEEKRPFLKRDKIPLERLYQARSVEGVERASPVWMERLFWTNEGTGVERSIRVIAFDPDQPVFLNDAITAQTDALRPRGTALLDARSRATLGNLETDSAIVQQREIDVVGTFELGSDFEIDGNLVVSEETFNELTEASGQYIEAVLVHVAPGASPDEVAAALRDALPGDVHVLTKAAIEARDLEYWKTGTPVSVILLVGVSLGFAVGVVICYQILYTDVLDHLAEFATLKAMGYGNGFFRWVVLWEAWVLSLAGFLPGVLLGWIMMWILGAMSGLPAGIDAGNMLQVGLLSVVMCSLAGALALRRVEQLDPAELF